MAIPVAAADEDVRARVESETDIRVLEPWYDDALGIFDEASAQRLVEHVRRTPPRSERR